jgi:hypothetical protein
MGTFKNAAYAARKFFRHPRKSEGEFHYWLLDLTPQVQIDEELHHALCTEVFIGMVLCKDYILVTRTRKRRCRTHWSNVYPGGTGMGFGLNHASRQLLSTLSERYCFGLIRHRCMLHEFTEHFGSQQSLYILRHCSVRLLLFRLGYLTNHPFTIIHNAGGASPLDWKLPLGCTTPNILCLVTYHTSFRTSSLMADRPRVTPHAPHLPSLVSSSSNPSTYIWG